MTPYLGVEGVNDEGCGTVKKDWAKAPGTEKIGLTYSHMGM
jgi:hypothetical protein